MPHFSKQFEEAQDRDSKVHVLTEDSAEASDRPDYVASIYRDQIADVKFLRDVYGGTKTLRKGGEKYLPKHGEEDDEDWRKRRDKSVAFNATRRTVGGLTGMVFRKDPVLDTETTPEAIQEDVENVDLAGRDLATFARHTFENAVIDGHSYILVEFPKVDQGTVNSRADESGRPYWVNLTKSQVHNLRWEMRGGRPFLTLAVWSETVTEGAGDFGETTVERYQVRRPGEFEVWEKRAEGDEGDRVRFVMVENGPVSLDYIPLTVVYANRTGLFRSDPPLLDLAFENVAHYQIRSDHRYALSFASVPMPFIKGMDPSSVLWGPNRAITTDAENADAKILESSGSALKQSRQELQDIEGRMALLGLQMLAESGVPSASDRTATARILDKAESDSSLASAARNLQNALESALQAHADFRRLPDGGSVIVNRDFQTVTMSPQMIAALSAAVQAGNLSLETMWDVLVAGEILPEDFDPELERERIQVTGPMTDLLALTEAGRRSPEEEPPLPDEAA